MGKTSCFIVFYVKTQEGCLRSSFYTLFRGIVQKVRKGPKKGKPRKGCFSCFSCISSNFVYFQNKVLEVFFHGLNATVKKGPKKNRTESRPNKTFIRQSGQAPF